MNQSDINALLNNTATIETKIEILPKVSGESIVTITNDNSVKSWTYSDLRYVEDVGFIGQFVARTLDGELQDITDDFNIQDREIKLYIGIRVPNEQGVYSTTYYCLGNFLVQAPESDEVNDNTKFESFDYTVLFNKEFDGDFKNTTYTKSFNEYIDNKETVTALWLAQYTCAQAGVVLGTTNFLNNNFTIDTNQFDSTSTCRDVVKSIAKLAYTWARIGWDNKLYFDFTVKSTVEQTYNNITNDNYYSLVTQKEKYGPVNRVLIGTSFADGDNEHIDDAASISANGLHELFIYDNPLTYTEEIRKQVINSGNCLFGLTYTALDMETTGHPWLQGNELISVEDMEGNKLYTYPFDRVIKYNGHIKSQITSYAKTGQEESMIYEGDDSDYGKYKKTQIILDRQNQEITAISEKVDMATDAFKISNQVSGTTVETENAGSYLPLNFTFYGDSYQYTTDGHNMASWFDFSASPSTKGWYSTTGNGFQSCTFADNVMKLVAGGDIGGSVNFYTDLTGARAFGFKKNTKYTFSAYVKGTLTGSNFNEIAAITNQTTLTASGWYQTGAVKKKVNFDSVISETEWNRVSVEFTMPNNDDNVMLFIRFSCTGTTYFKNVQIEEGSVTDYQEPYIIPSPEHPSEIDVLDGIRNLFSSEIEQGALNAGDGTTYDEATRIRTKDFISVQGNKKYLLSYSESLSFYTFYYDKNKSFIGKGGQWFNNGDCFTVSNNTGYVKMSFKNSSSTNIVPSNISNVMLEEGTTKHNYVPYGQNYLPINNTGYNLIQTNTSTHSAYKNFYTFDEIGSYTLTIENSEVTNGETEKFLVALLDVSKNTIYQDKLLEIGKKVRHTLNIKESDLGHKLIIYSSTNYPSSVNVTVKFTGIMLTKGLFEKDYMDYKKRTINIPIGDMFFGKIGDAQDSGYVDFSTSKVVRNGAIGKTVLTGVEDIVRQETVNKYWRFTISIGGNKSIKVDGASDVNYIMSDKLKAGTRDNTYNEVECICYGISSGYYKDFVIYTDATKSMSIDEFKAWLIDNPVTVYYILAEPMSEEKDLTEEELNQLELDSGYNMLYINDILEPKIDLTYLNDSDLNNVYSTQSQLKLENNKISSSVSETQRIVGSNYDEVNSKLDKKLEDSDLGAVLKDYASSESVLELTSKVDTYQTSTEQYIGVVNNIKQNGVDKITTETGYTFDKTGLTVSKTGADTKTTITEDGMHIYNTTGSTPIEVQRVDSSGVYSENVKINTYLIVGTHCRFENYEDGTGAFYIG